jgi:hypothetical protein
MSSCEFEEREYEAALYVQLQHSSADVWAPGQVLEAQVGFDHSLFTSHPYFWKLQGFAAPPAGVVLGNRPPRYWWHEPRFDRQLPDFSLNLFIQAKRPSIGSRVNSKLKALGLKGPYWRFEVSKHQQLVLEALAASTSGSALVCYASPAFHRITELWAHSRAGSMVETSTFPPATSLRDHEVWYYTAPGCVGIANPVPERIEEPSLLDRIRELSSGFNGTSDGDRYESNLSRLGASVVKAVHSTPDTGRTAVFFESLREIDRGMDTLRPHRYADAIRGYLQVATFASVFNVQWHVLGRGEG